MPSCRRSPTVVSAVLGVVLVAASSGCSRLDLRQGFCWFDPQDEPQVPQRIADFWEPAVLNQPGLPGVRGFGGRIHFYNRQSKRPVVVDGTLIVFAFDAADDDLGGVRPLKKFIFPTAKLPDRLRKSDLGPCYDFWLPWEEVGGPQRHLRLAARFEAATGEVIAANESRHTLPGYVARPQTPAYAGGSPTLHHLNVARGTVPAPAGAVRQVAHEAPAPTKAAMTTSTISLTPSFTQQVMAAAPGGPNLRPPLAVRTPGDPTTVLPMRQIPIGSAQPSQPAQPAQLAPPGQLGPPAQQPGVPWPSAADRSPSAHFGPGRYPAPAGASAGPGYDPGRRGRPPARWPSRLPPTPRWGYSGGFRHTPAADASRPY